MYIFYHKYFASPLVYMTKDIQTLGWIITSLLLLFTTFQQSNKKIQQNIEFLICSYNPSSFELAYRISVMNFPSSLFCSFCF